MLATLLVFLFAVAAALVTIVVAFKFVPPMRIPKSGGELLRGERASVAASEIKEELDSLRKVVLQQRLEIAQLRREARLQRDMDPRRQELEARKRRARLEAQQFNKMPLGSVEKIASS
jgi:hypothetical protein